MNILIGEELGLLKVPERPRRQLRALDTESAIPGWFEGSSACLTQPPPKWR